MVSLIGVDSGLGNGVSSLSSSELGDKSLELENTLLNFVTRRFLLGGILDGFLVGVTGNTMRGEP